MTQAKEKAQEFLERETAFRLGQLLTESSHSKTCMLSKTIQADLPAGIRMLQSVDEDIAATCDRLFAQESYSRLITAILEALNNGRRVFFTGCGATGRLSILLEAAWRRFWREDRGTDPSASAMVDRCISVMAGGDFALIKSVEGFEDFPEFGRYQLREAGVQEGDVVVAITEGGETPFVIGTAWQGLDTGATVFFVYNNPTDLLRQNVERSRQVIDEPRIGKLDLTTGPMAISGSTRMQATTAELLVVGAALETALAQWLQEHAQSQVGWTVNPSELYCRRFKHLLADLSTDAAVRTLASLTRFEEAIYRQHGLVTYAADSVLLDVLTDTTERSPTFMVPPFRQNDDVESPVSWAFVKNPYHLTPKAWTEMLQRSPRGLDWGQEVHRLLGAPTALQANPPQLDNRRIHRFEIGNETDRSRTQAPDSALVAIEIGDRAVQLQKDAVQAFETGYSRKAVLAVGEMTQEVDACEYFSLPCALPSSPLRLWEHLAVKLILNTVSTATMVRLERVIGNAMVWVSPSNKKLIDRGTRLIAQQAGCDYERACEALFEAMETVAGYTQQGKEPPSPVALAIERISNTNRKDAK